MTISATTQGIKPGVCTSTTRPVTPFTGMIIYETDTLLAKVWTGSAWADYPAGKANTASPTFTGTVVLPSTTSIGNVTSTEIGYVDGVTSAIQTQLDSKITATTAITSNRNAFINGAMNVWQRGTTSGTLGLGGGSYVGPDRWWFYNNGFTTTISRQPCGSTLPQFQYCARIQRTSGQTSIVSSVFFSPLETANSVRFAGKNATLSFYARASSGISSATALGINVFTGTGTDQSNFGGGAYTGLINAIGVTPTLTTSWQRFTATGAISSTATEIGIQIGFIPVGTAGASDYFEITGIQLEEGAVATPFEFEDYGITLQKCQRYFQTYVDPPLRGVVDATTRPARVAMLLTTPMRVAPTMPPTVSGTLSFFDGSATGNYTSVHASFAKNTSVEFDLNLTVGFATPGRAAVLYQGGGGSMSFSAEL